MSTHFLARLLLKRYRLYSGRKARMKRTLQEVREDMRALLDQLAIAKEAKSPEGIAYCTREFRACERELIFLRYGRTDVK